MTVKVYKVSDSSHPDYHAFCTHFVDKRVVLQKTDLINNNNKYYNLELQTAGTK